MALGSIARAQRRNKNFRVLPGRLDCQCTVTGISESLSGAVVPTRRLQNQVILLIRQINFAPHGTFSINEPSVLSAGCFTTCSFSWTLHWLRSINSQTSTPKCPSLISDYAARTVHSSPCASVLRASVVLTLVSNPQSLDDPRSHYCFKALLSAPKESQEGFRKRRQTTRVRPKVGTTLRHVLRSPFPTGFLVPLAHFGTCSHPVIMTCHSRDPDAHESAKGALKMGGKPG